MQDPELARIWRDGLVSRETLSELDRRRFDPLISIMLNAFQQQFRLARKGVLDPKFLADLQQGVHRITRQPGYRQWWEQWAGITYPGDTATSAQRDQPTVQYCRSAQDAWWTSMKMAKAP